MHAVLSSLCPLRVQLTLKADSFQMEPVVCKVRHRYHAVATSAKCIIFEGGDMKVVTWKGAAGQA
jgi:hypothetical protein